MEGIDTVIARVVGGLGIALAGAVRVDTDLPDLAVGEISIISNGNKDGISGGVRLDGRAIEFTVTLPMVCGAKPHDFERLSIIVMVRVDEVGCAAPLAWLLHELPDQHGSFHNLVSEIFLPISVLPSHVFSAIKVRTCAAMAAQTLYLCKVFWHQFLPAEKSSQPGTSLLFPAGCSLGGETSNKDRITPRSQGDDQRANPVAMRSMPVTPGMEGDGPRVLQTPRAMSWAGPDGSTPGPLRVRRGETTPRLPLDVDTGSRS